MFLRYHPKYLKQKAFGYFYVNKSSSAREHSWALELEHAKFLEHSLALFFLGQQSLYQTISRHGLSVSAGQGLTLRDGHPALVAKKVMDSLPCNLASVPEDSPRHIAT